ncbi:MAG: hypothetical protein DGJ47_000802 [Rickettsiaceae bacterium]
MLVTKGKDMIKKPSLKRLSPSKLKERSDKLKEKSEEKEREQNEQEVMQQERDERIEKFFTNYFDQNPLSKQDKINEAEEEMLLGEESSSLDPIDN